MAKLELPELEQNQEVNIQNLFRTQENAPQRTKKNWLHSAYRMNCLNSLITNQKTASPKTKDNQKQHYWHFRSGTKTNSLICGSELTEMINFSRRSLTL